MKPQEFSTPTDSYSKRTHADAVAEHKASLASGHEWMAHADPERTSSRTIDAIIATKAAREHWANQTEQPVSTAPEAPVEDFVLPEPVEQDQATKVA